QRVQKSRLWFVKLVEAREHVRTRDQRDRRPCVLRIRFKSDSGITAVSHHSVHLLRHLPFDLSTSDWEQQAMCMGGYGLGGSTMGQSEGSAAQDSSTSRNRVAGVTTPQNHGTDEK